MRNRESLYRKWLVDFDTIKHLNARHAKIRRPIGPDLWDDGHILIELLYHILMRNNIVRLHSAACTWALQEDVEKFTWTLKLRAPDVAHDKHLTVELLSLRMHGRYDIKEMHETVGKYPYDYTHQRISILFLRQHDVALCERAFSTHMFSYARLFLQAHCERATDAGP